MIRAGRVSVNHKIVREPGMRIEPREATVTLDGRPVPPPGEIPRRTVMLHKPVGWLCSMNAAQGPVVSQWIADLPERLLPVGRLDKDSSGLLLLSNDGDLMARLTHPRYGHRKLYDVEVAGYRGDESLARLRAPMSLEGHELCPVEIRPLRRVGRRTWLRFVLREGRNRQIRRMCARSGLQVLSLTRIGIDSLRLGRLKPGEWRDLTPEELARLQSRKTSPL